MISLGDMIFIVGAAAVLYGCSQMGSGAIWVGGGLLGCVLALVVERRMRPKPPRGREGRT